MTNSLQSGASGEMLITTEPAAADDSLRRVADLIENRTSGIGTDIWSEPDIKQSSDAEEERAAAKAVPLEEQEGIDDPVRMYLREIGKVFLLSAADEKRLARQMEEGQHIEAIEDSWSAENGAPPRLTEIALMLFEQLTHLKPTLDLAVKHLKASMQNCGGFMGSESELIADRLIAAIRSASIYNANVQVAPACILWPDGDRQWEPVVARLQRELPELCVLGDFTPSDRTGPAIWLRLVIADKLDEVKLPSDKTPRCIAAWRNDYNDDRPHESLNGLTPSEYARRCAPQESGGKKIRGNCKADPRKGS